MISLSNMTMPQQAAVGTVVGALAVYQNGVAVSGATFLIDDDQSDFTISGSNLTLGTALASAGFYDVKIDAVVSGVIVDCAEFAVNVIAVSPDGTIIMAPSGSLVSAVGTWSFGPAVANKAGEYQIMLNGTQAAGGFGSKLLIANSGTIYALGVTTWFQYIPATGTAVGVWKSLNTTTTP